MKRTLAIVLLAMLLVATVGVTAAAALFLLFFSVKSTKQVLSSYC